MGAQHRNRDHRQPRKRGGRKDDPQIARGKRRDLPLRPDQAEKEMNVGQDH
jgi:hypothetical protein